MKVAGTVMLRECCASRRPSHVELGAVDQHPRSFTSMDRGYATVPVWPVVLYLLVTTHAFT